MIEILEMSTPKNEWREAISLGKEGQIKQLKKNKNFPFIL